LVICSRYVSGDWWLNVESWVVSIVCKERCLFGGRVYCVVIGKLSKREEVDPIILLVIYKTAEILLEDLIDSFSLSIRLWVKGRGQVDLCTQELEQAGPEFRSKLGATIGNHIIRQAMKSHHVFEE
jgi:hypothetical protein